jgi:hypothetical protein
MRKITLSALLCKGALYKENDFSTTGITINTENHNEIANAVEESGIRNDGDSIKYVLLRVWERFEFLAPPDLKSLTD